MRSRLSRFFPFAGIVGMIVVPMHASAQGDDPSLLDAVMPLHRIEVTPHRVVLDKNTRSTTITITNRGTKPTAAQIHVVFAYSVWPHGLPWDTTLFTPHWETLVPHDTTVLNPRSSDPSAAKWIRGAPTEVLLAPGERRQITLQLTPPSELRTREYWARVVATVSPVHPQDKPGKPKDEKMVYKLPVHGIVPQPLRDSTIIFFRPAAMTMGITIPHHTVAVLDERQQYPFPPGGCPCRRVWYRIPVHLTGNATYQGTLHVQYQQVESGKIIWTQDRELTLYHDAVLHGWSEFHPNFPKGKYRFIATFDNTHTELPPIRRLAMPVVSDTVLFEAH
jgi:hypothetical protein